MKNRFASGLICTLAAAGLVGCGATGMPTADILLAGAHGSLVDNDTGRAREWLASAEPRLETNRQWKEHQLLTAELDIRTGQAELARPTVTHLLERYPDDPRVHELAGKVRLAVGDFPGAVRQFSTAAGQYRNDEDIARATDLVVLAEGFEAFAGGRMAAARQRWEAIQDRRLRASVFNASDEGGGQVTGTLARSNQLIP